MKKVIPLLAWLASLGVAWAQPTNNPYATRYPNAAPSHWTHVLKWSSIYDVTTYGAIPNDGGDDQVAVETAIDAAHVAGGGIVYFPTGTYHFSKDLVLKSGVILRGDNPNIPDAKVAGYLPPSRLEFPQYIFDTTANGGLGNPDSTAFKAITCQTTVQNIGVVNLDVNRARIEFFPDFDSLGIQTAVNGPTPNYQPRQQNRNFIVFGVRSNNAAFPDPSIPGNYSGPDQMRPWQRWMYQFTANIDLYLHENAVIANNRINDHVTDNFEQPNYRVRNRCTGCNNYKNVGRPSDAAWNAANYVPVLSPEHAPFDYTAHYGISLNRNKKVEQNGRRTIKPMFWYPEPWNEPTLYAKGFEVLDNYLFKTNRVGIWCAGMGMTLKGNIIRDTAINNSAGWATPKKRWLNTNGTEVLRNFSATYENRGIDFGGSNITIEDNDVLVSTADFPESAYGSVDGEGIMDQGNGGGTNPNGIIIRNNRVASNRDDCTNPTIGLYRTGDINNVIYEDNVFTGNSRCMQIETREQSTMTNVVVRNNQNIKTLLVSAVGGGYNARAYDNVGTQGGGIMRISCFVQETNNQGLTLASAGCTPLSPTGVDTTLFPRITMVNPMGDLVLGAALPTFDLKAVVSMNVDSVVFYLDAFNRLGKGLVTGDTALLTWTMPTEDGQYPITAVAYYRPAGATRSAQAKSAFARIIIDDGDPLTNNPKDIVASAKAPVVDASLQLYPNPARDQVTITSSAQLQEVKIFDLLGKCVQTTAARGNSAVLSLAGLSRGVYMVQTIGQGRIGTRRLVVE